MSVLYTASMPRQPRIDAPGLLYHVIARGVERKAIFRDDADRQFFLNRLGQLVKQTGTPIYSYALVPNHFHLLLRRGKTPLSKFMLRLLTGYAIYFNRRHMRVGHLFQNRYKSVVCQEDVYFHTLVRYINLNPVRAGVVKSFEELASYRYASHSFLIGKRKPDWLEVDEVLAMFGSKKREARIAYADFVSNNEEDADKGNLDGGGLMRSLAFTEQHPREKQVYDERVLGIGDFVEGLQGQCGEDIDKAPAISPEDILTAVSIKYGIPEALITGRTKIRPAVRARRIFAYRLATQAGMSGSDIARLLSVSRTTASKMIRIGESIG